MRGVFVFGPVLGGAPVWLAVWCAVAGGAFPLRAQEPHPAQTYWTARLADLNRPDARAGTLGSVGRRLWATRLLPLPGFCGEAHYIHHTPALRDPLRVEFVTLAGKDVDLALRAQSWTPLGSRVEYAVPLTPRGRIVEHRTITPDDTFVSSCELFELPTLRVRWRAPLAPNPDDEARFAAVDVGAGDVELATAASLRLGDPQDPVWVEGEAAVRSPPGGAAPKRVAASGGAVLVLGDACGQSATWCTVGTGEGEWTVCVRYARAGESAARLQLGLDGEVQGELACAPTGGEGDEMAHFAWSKLVVGALAAGPRTLTLTALRDGAEVSIDGLLVMPSTRADDPPPPMPAWPRFDPLRGAVLHDAAVVRIDGVPFTLPAPGRGRACTDATEFALAGVTGFVHVLLVPTSGEASVVLGTGAPVSLGLRQRDWRRHVAVLATGPADRVLRVLGGVLLAVTREAVAAGVERELRRGEATFHGVRTHVQASVHGLEHGRLTPPADAGKAAVVRAELSLRSSTAGAAPSASPATADHELVPWLAARAPRLTCADPLFANLWTYRWFLVHHNTAWPDAGYLPGGPVVYEGRHGSWYPRVITFSTPHIVAETRWLGDPALTFGNVRAHLRNAVPGEDLPNVLVDWRGFRYTNWIGEAVVEACKVHGDRAVLAEVLPGLARNVHDLVAKFDPDGDGLLAPGDHYTTGMEFQPSFWFHVGYDNSKPQTDLERPDFNAYVFGSAKSLAEAARWLGDGKTADALEQVAQRIRTAVLAKLWHGEDRFFYSVREKDGDPARCAEVIGFYPFRFDLVPIAAPFTGALAKLADPAEFFAPCGPTSCSRRVPVFSAAVQQWPGPGGVVQPCMWNGPSWPHATSLVIDAVARVVRGTSEPNARLFAARAADGSPLSDARFLGELMRRYARFHCEGGDPARPLLREYGDADSGRNWGCADYLHSTFNDLVIRHWAGLVLRFDNTLEVRPLDLGLGDVRIDEIAYHGRKVSIALAGEVLEVFVDGKSVGKGNAGEGLAVDGALR